MKLYLLHIAKISFASVLALLWCNVTCSAADTIGRGNTIIKNTKLADGQKRLATAFKNVDTSRIVKKHPTFINKNASKSAQDPNALSFGTFKVSEQLYGSYAPYIIEYVKNYHNNFGARMGRVKSANKGYFTMIDNTMRKSAIPKEMHSLAVIESGLNPNATSPVGAVGPWQFMPATATMLGLQVTELQDDRRDFIKSTQAAVKFTKRLHNMFHDWLLVVAAYNCGPSPVLRHLSRTGGKSFWDIKQYLPKETQNHVMAFIATSLYYDKNSKVLDLGNLPKNAKAITQKDLGTAIAKKKVDTKKTNAKPVVLPIPDDEDDLAIDEDDESNNQQILPDEVGQVLTLKLKGAYNIEAIAEILDYDLNKLRRWNPKFNEQTAQLGAQVKLTLPSSKLDAFLIQKDKILKQSIANPIVKSGTTFFVKNQAVTIVADATNTAKTPAATQAPLSQEERKRILLAEMAKKNKLAEEKIVESKTIEEEKSTEKKTYTIKKGDKLTHIAEQFGMTIARLMELNNMKEQVIVPGHKLFLE